MPSTHCARAAASQTPAQSTAVGAPSLRKRQRRTPLDETPPGGDYDAAPTRRQTVLARNCSTNKRRPAARSSSRSNNSSCHACASPGSPSSAVDVTTDEDADADLDVSGVVVDDICYDADALHQVNEANRALLALLEDAERADEDEQAQLRLEVASLQDAVDGMQSQVAAASAHLTELRALVEALARQQQYAHLKKQRVEGSVAATSRQRAA